MLSSGKRSLSREDIKTADKDEKVSISYCHIDVIKEHATLENDVTLGGKIDI